MSEIERALATVNVDASLLLAFVDELGDRLAVERPGTGPGAAMVLVPPGRLSAPQGEEDAVRAAQRQLVDRLRVGDWWDFGVEGGRIPIARRVRKLRPSSASRACLPA